MEGHRTTFTGPLQKLSQPQESAGLTSGNTDVLKVATSIGFVVSFLCCKQTSPSGSGGIVDLTTRQIGGKG
jgi:hypothetical protein